MPDEEVIEEMQALDAIAAERGAALAFRMCDESEDFEPVFVRLHRANAGEPNESALLALDDASGLSLGRYVMSRARLEALLADADAIADEEPEEAGLVHVPSEWEAREA